MFHVSMVYRKSYLRKEKKKKKKKHIVKYFGESNDESTNTIQTVFVPTMRRKLTINLLWIVCLFEKSVLLLVLVWFFVCFLVCFTFFPMYNHSYAS